MNKTNKDVFLQDGNWKDIKHKRRKDVTMAKLTPYKSNTDYECVRYLYSTSILSWVDYAKREDVTPMNNDSREESSGDGFHDYKNWQDCMGSAEKGRPDLLKKLEDVDISLNSPDSNYLSITQSLSGYSLNMGQFLSGHPECWNKLKERQGGSRGGKIKNIICNFSVSANVKSDIIVRRGLVITAIIDILESMGYRVSLDIAYTSEKKNCYQVCCMNFKTPESPLDKNLLAFYMMSNDSFRRIYFSIYERFVDYDGKKYYSKYYGYPDTFNTLNLISGIDMRDEYDILFDTKSGKLRGKYGTKQNTIRTFNNILKSMDIDIDLQFND